MFEFVFFAAAAGLLLWLVLGHPRGVKAQREATNSLRDHLSEGTRENISEYNWGPRFNANKEDFEKAMRIYERRARSA